jgi:selenocysteine-specific elongation factor
MHVIATAGHVDHGKSTLVRALTGMEPDRWAEERRRGMTIDLGFAWTTMPTGGQLAFVDVPGHERFVTNMLAGIGPAPAVMFVVAADEGWMPQSAEHLAAVDALEIRHGLLVVTRADLADPGPAMTQASAEIGRTSLGAIERVAVSGHTGAGLDDVRAALGRLAARLPGLRTDGPVRLWVDRVFTIRGSGTVVTGTLPAGRVSQGDELELAPTGRRVRVRAVESLKQRTDTVCAVARVAVNLRGMDRGDVTRGMALITPDCWTVTELADVRLGGVDSADLPRELDLHTGSARVRATVRRLGPDTVRLALSRPLPLHVGDRALIRDGLRRIAGVRILDVLPPPLRRRGGAADRDRQLRRAGDVPDGDFFLRQHGLLRRSQLAAIGCVPAGIPITGEWVADPVFWQKLGERLRQCVAAHAASCPLEPGLPIEAARRSLGLADRRLVEALVQPPLRSAAGRIFAQGRVQGLPPEVAIAVDRVRADLARRPFQAPEADRLVEFGLDRRALGAAARAGALLKVAEGVVLLPGADAAAVAVLSGLPQPFTTSQARQALDTTRRIVIPLLEYLDRCGYTERISSTHRRCATASKIECGTTRD